MKKIDGYGIWGLGQWPVIPSTGVQRESSGCEQESAGIFSSPRYPIREKDMGKIHRAASAGIVAKVQHALILRKNGVNDKDKRNRTALHFACAYGHPQVVTLLLERKCDINVRDDDNCTPLIKAVQCQEEECVDILLEHGADPNAMDASGHTALHYAVYSKNTSIAAQLLSHNANIEAKNKDGLTPLLLALMENKQRIAEFLVEKKANIHAVDKMRRTALMLAVRYKSANIVKLLLQQGIDVFYKDANGQIASDHALAGPCDINRQIIFEHEEKILKMSQNRNLAEADLAVTSKDGRRRLHGSASEQFQVEEEWMEHKSNEMEASPNLCGGDNDNEEEEEEEEEKDKEEEEEEKEEEEHDKDGGSIQRKKNEKAENQQFPLQGNEEHDEQITFEHEEKRFKNSQESHLVDENSEDDSLTRLSNNPGPGDPWPASDEDSFTFNTKKNTCSAQNNNQVSKQTLNNHMDDPKVNLKELWKAFQKSRKNEEKYGIWKPQNINLFEDGDSENQTKKQNNKSGLGEEEEEDVESPWDSESISESLPQNCVGHLSKDKNEREKHIINEHVEGFPEKYSQLKATIEMKDSFPNKAVGTKDVQTFKSEPDIEMTSEEGQKRLDVKEKNEQLDVPKVNLKELLRTFQESRTNRKYGIGKPKNITLFENSDSENQNKQNNKSGLGGEEDVELPCGSESISESLPQRCVGHLSRAKDERGKHIVNGHVDEPDIEMMSEEGQNRLDVMENNQLLNVPKGNLTEPWKTAQLPQKNSITCASVSGEEEDVKSPWDSESFSESLPRKCVGHAPRAEDGREKHTVNMYVEAEQDIEMALEETQTRLDGSENNQPLNVPKRNLTEPWKAAQQSRKKQEKYGIGKPQTITLFDDINSESQNDDQNIKIFVRLVEEEDAASPWDSENNSESLSQKCVEDQRGKHTINELGKEFPEKYLHMMPIIEMKDSVPKTAARTKDGQIFKPEPDLEMTSEEMQKRLAGSEKGQPQNVPKVNLTEPWKPQQSRENRLREEGIESPQDSEHTSESLPQKCIDHLSIAEDQRRKHTVNGHVTAEPDLEVTSEEGQKRIDFRENNQLWVEEGKEKKSNETVMSENVCDGAAAEGDGHDDGGASRQRKSDKADNQRSPIKGNEEHDEIELEEETKRRNSNLFYEKFKEELGEKEKQYNKGVEVKQQLKICLKKIDTELKSVRIHLNQVLEERNAIERQFCQQQNARMVHDGVVANHFCEQKEIEMAQNKVSVSHERENELLHKTHMLQDKIAMLRLEIDTIKSQNQEKEKKYLQDIEVVKIKNDNLLRTIKLNEEIFTKTVIQYTEQLNILTAENAMLNSKLENQGQNKKGLETEVKTDHSQLPAAIYDHDQNQTSKRDLELQEDQDKHSETLQCSEKIQDHLQKLELENSKLKVKIKKQARKIEQLQKKLLSRNLTDDLTAEPEASSSKCLHLDKKNQFLRQEFLPAKTIQKKCEKLEKDKKKLEQEITSLKNHIEKNMVEYNQVEQYKQEIKERARQDLVGKLRQVNLFLQTQAERQKHLEQLNEKNNASIRSMMEHRIKDLEYELSTMKTQNNSNKSELEKYKQFYQEESKNRKSLSSELNKLHWTDRLEEGNKKPLEREQNRPVQECSSVRNLTRGLGHNRHFIVQPSNESIENYMTEIEKKLKIIAKGVNEAAVEFKYGFF